MRYHDLCTRLLSANRLYPMAPKAATEARAIITTSAPVSSLLFIVPTKVKRDEIKIKITSLHPTGYPGDLKFPGSRTLLGTMMEVPPPDNFLDMGKEEGR